MANPSGIQFPVISLEDLFTRYEKLSRAKFRILKMDIEGAELEILKLSITQINRFDFLAIEMDSLALIPFFSTLTRFKRIVSARRIVAELEGTGQWGLVKIENFNFFWSKFEH